MKSKLIRPIYLESVRILKDKFTNDISADNFLKNHAHILINELTSKYTFSELLGEKQHILKALKERFPTESEPFIVMIRNNEPMQIKKATTIDSSKFKRLVMLGIKVLLSFDKKTLLQPTASPHVMKVSKEKILRLKQSIKADDTQFEAIIKQSLRQHLKLQFDESMILLDNEIIVQNLSDEHINSSLPIKKFNKIEKKYALDNIDLPVHIYLDELLAIELNFSIIDNLFFSRNYLKLFHKIIAKFTKNLLTEEVQFVKQFTMHLLRKHLDDMMLYCAKNLLEHASKGDENAQKFILFFDGESLTIDNKKCIKKPVIHREDGANCDLKEMLKREKIYTEIYTKIKEQHEKINDAKETVEKYERERKSIVEDRKSHKNQYTAFISQNRDKIQKIIVKKNALNSDEEHILKMKNTFENTAKTLNQRVIDYKRDNPIYIKALENETLILRALEEKLKVLEEQHKKTIYSVAKTIAKRFH